MKVLRERLLPREMSEVNVTRNPADATGRGQDSRGLRSKQPQLETAEDCLSKKIEVVVCNGNDTVGGFESQCEQNTCFFFVILHIPASDKAVRE